MDNASPLKNCTIVCTKHHKDNFMYIPWSFFGKLPASYQLSYQRLQDATAIAAQLF